MKYRYKKSCHVVAFSSIFIVSYSFARFNWLIKISIRILRIINYYTTMVEINRMTCNSLVKVGAPLRSRKRRYN